MRQQDCVWRCQIWAGDENEAQAGLETEMQMESGYSGQISEPTKVIRYKLRLNQKIIVKVLRNVARELCNRCSGRPTLSTHNSASFEPPALPLPAGLWAVLIGTTTSGELGNQDTWNDKKCRALRNNSCVWWGFRQGSDKQERKR